jgi:hypothetical protein
MLRSLRGTEGLAGLETLSLLKATSIRSLDGLERFPRLRHLDICGCRALNQPGILAGLPGNLQVDRD